MMLRPMIFICALGLALVAGAASATAEDLAKLKKAILEEKAIVLDVREKAEWNKAHLKLSRSVPISTISLDKEARHVAASFPEPTEVKIYTLSNTGKRAEVAAQLFKRVGVKVTPLKLSYRSLVDAGFEEKKAGEPNYDSRIQL